MHNIPLKFIMNINQPKQFLKNPNKQPIWIPAFHDLLLYYCGFRCTYIASFPTSRKPRKAGPEVLGPGWPFLGQVCGPRESQPRCLEEDCEAAAPRAGAGQVVGVVPVFPRSEVPQVPLKRSFSLGSRCPAQCAGGWVLPCPAVPWGCFGQGTVLRHTAS